MIGCIRCEQTGVRCPPVWREIAGLELLELRWHEPEHLPRRKAERRLERMERTLYRQGINRVILPEDFPRREQMKRVRSVDILPLYHAMCDVFVLEWLRRRGIPPTMARVAIASPRLTPAVRDAAERLCLRVRELSVLVPEGGEAYARLLHSRYGLPVRPGTAPVDVTVAFAPTPGLAGGILGLHGAAGGVRLVLPGLDCPEEYSQPILALLWEYGRLRREELRAIFC